MKDPSRKRWTSALCALALVPGGVSVAAADGGTPPAPREAAPHEDGRRIVTWTGDPSAADRRPGVQLTGGRRRALVIGNDAYANLPRLANAVHDARAMKSVLEELGFDVELVIDAGAAGFRRAVSAFANRLGIRDVGLLYYSGHGLQLQGENYLIPVDFEAADEIDARFASYPADQALQSLEKSGAALNILILDACRDNPFAETSSGPRGLAIMNAGRGTLIAFATGPGRTASDGRAGANGLFTSHLIEKLRTPGLSIDQVFNQVALAVDTASRGRQTPWVVKSLMGDFYFRAPNGNGDGGIIERAFWDSVKDSHDAEELRAYVKAYPDGRFVDLARIRLRDFDAAGASPAEEPTCAPATECTRLGYRHQTGGGAANLELAAVYYRQGCAAGDARACTNLGVMFENGQGVYGDEVKAAELYDDGCEGGDSLGCTYLGFMYQGGRGVPASPVKAYEMFRLGCEASHSVACTHLGISYETGKGVKVDYGRAGRFYSQGCAGHHAPGCRRLGLLYDRGLGVAADPMQAAELYRLACVGKDAPACTFLGLLYSKGEGVARNRAIAASRYREGCGYGDQSGCENLRILCRQHAYPACAGGAAASAGSPSSRGIGHRAASLQ